MSCNNLLNYTFYKNNNNFICADNLPNSSIFSSSNVNDFSQYLNIPNKTSLLAMNMNISLCNLCNLIKNIQYSNQFKKSNQVDLDQLNHENNLMANKKHNQNYLIKFLQFYNIDYMSKIVKLNNLNSVVIADYWLDKVYLCRFLLANEDQNIKQKVKDLLLFLISYFIEISCEDGYALTEEDIIALLDDRLPKIVSIVNVII